MKRYMIIIATLAAIGGSHILADGTMGKIEARKTQGVSGKKAILPYKEGEVIVEFKAKKTENVLSSLYIQKDFYVKKLFKRFHKKGALAVLKSKKTTREMIKALRNDPNVKSAFPNYRRTLSGETPDDTYFDQMIGLNNVGQNTEGTAGKSDADIDAPEAWAKTTGSSNVVVAVFDTGVDYMHEDLSENMWINVVERDGLPGVDDDGNGYVDDIYGYDMAGNLKGDNDPDPMDIMGHGTHVSGIIGAKGNNGIGIAGVNWNVKIMALKVFRPNLSAYDSDILEAIDYVLKMKNDYGINIVAVNASYGGYGGDQNDPMSDAIKSLGEAGIILVASAGNRANDNDTNIRSYPASYDADNIIVVAATDPSDNLATFSNYGLESVDLAAPGVNIISTLPSYPMPSHEIFWDSVSLSKTNWSSNAGWNITTKYTRSESHVWSDSPSGNYSNEADNTLVYEKDINLIAFREEKVGLGNCISYEIEDGYDYLYIDASGDSGKHWTTLRSITGSSGRKWECGGVVIPETMKTAHFRVRFRLVADESVSEDGVYIGNISIGSIQGSDNYAYWSGTSMAAPHVTGAVALLASKHTNETLYKRVMRIQKSIDKKSSLSGKVSSGGRLNINAAIRYSFSDSHTLVAVEDHAFVQARESVKIDVLSNDFHGHNDALTLESISAPAHGHASIIGRKILYTPNKSYIGKDSFTYTVYNESGDRETAVVSVTVLDKSEIRGAGNGGGCTYNPRAKNIDLMMAIMIIVSLLYPVKGRLLKRFR